MNSWSWDNPHAFGNQVGHSNAQTTSSGKVKCTGEHFSWYGSNDLRAKSQPSSCQQYKPGDSDSLAIRQLNWDWKIDEDDDDEIWADPREPSSGRSRPSDGNNNDDSENEEDRQGGEKGTREEKGTKGGKGKGNGKGKGKEKWKGKAMEEAQGKGKGNGNGKGIVKQTPWGDNISHAILCSRSRKCMRQTPTQRAN